MEKQKRNTLKTTIMAVLLHAILSVIPFIAVFYFFIPLQAYTHWAFRAYWWLIWIAPLTGLIHLSQRRDTWRERAYIIGGGFAFWSIVIIILTSAWGTYTG